MPIELRNKTRSVFRFPNVELVQGKGTDPQLIANNDKDLVIGDSADEELEEGVERSELCPSPVVRLSEQEYEGLSKENKAILEMLIQNKQIEKRQVA